MFVRRQNLLHVEVCRRVYGMQQCPLVTERIVLAMQFSLDGTERLHHNLLTRLFGTAGLFSIIAARRDELPVGDIRLGVADDDNGEHVHILRVQVGEGSGLHLLLVATCLTDIADRRRCSPPLQKQFLEPIELPIAPVRLRIVDSRHEVALRSSTDAPFYHLPRCHQV